MSSSSLPSSAIPSPVAPHARVSLPAFLAAQTPSLVGFYLNRLQLSSSSLNFISSSDFLSKLIKRHVANIPVESFTAKANTGALIILIQEVLYDKIVLRRRGGIGLELNCLFGWLLAAIPSFSVHYLSATVEGKQAQSEGANGSEETQDKLNQEHGEDAGGRLPSTPDNHLILLVRCADKRDAFDAAADAHNGPIYLVDVGLGAGPSDKLIYQRDLIQHCNDGAKYRIVQSPADASADALQRWSATRNQWEGIYSFNVGKKRAQFKYTDYMAPTVSILNHLSSPDNLPFASLIRFVTSSSLIHSPSLASASISRRGSMELPGPPSAAAKALVAPGTLVGTGGLSPTAPASSCASLFCLLVGRRFIEYRRPDEQMGNVYTFKNDAQRDQYLTEYYRFLPENDADRPPFWPSRAALHSDIVGGGQFTVAKLERCHKFYQKWLDNARAVNNIASNGTSTDSSAPLPDDPAPSAAPSPTDVSSSLVRRSSRDHRPVTELYNPSPVMAKRKASAQGGEAGEDSKRSKKAGAGTGASKVRDAELLFPASFVHQPQSQPHTQTGPSTRSSVNPSRLASPIPGGDPAHSAATSNGSGPELRKRTRTAAHSENAKKVKDEAAHHSDGLNELPDSRALLPEYSCYFGCSYLPPFPLHHDDPPNGDPSAHELLIELHPGQYRTIEIPSSYTQALQELLRERADLQQLKQRLMDIIQYRLEDREARLKPYHGKFLECRDKSSPYHDKPLGETGLIVSRASRPSNRHSSPSPGPAASARSRHADEITFNYDPLDLANLLLFDFSPRTLCRYTHSVYSGREDQTWFHQVFPWEFDAKLLKRVNLKDYRRCHHLCGCSHNVNSPAIHPYFGISPVAIHEFAHHVSDAAQHRACQSDWSCFSFLTGVYRTDTETAEVRVDCSIEEMEDTVKQQEQGQGHGDDQAERPGSRQGRAAAKDENGGAANRRANGGNIRVKKENK